MKVVVRCAALALVLVGAACHPTGTATTRVGAPCHERKNCDSVCWEGSCTVACQTAADCPTDDLAPMLCIEGNVCVFACASQKECGGWLCIKQRRSERDEKVLVCIPRLNGDNPEDIDPDPPDQPTPPT